MLFLGQPVNLNHKCVRYKLRVELLGLNQYTNDHTLPKKTHQGGVEQWAKNHIGAYGYEILVRVMEGVLLPLAFA